MKRVVTATCLAAAFAVGLAAQTPQGTSGTMPDPQAQSGAQGRGAGPRTVTGCLRAGDTAGTFMLTDVQMPGRGDTATTGTSTTTGTGTTTGTSGTTAGQRSGMPMPTSITLNPESSVDLTPHVGHKIEVTGTFTGGGRRSGGDAPTTATATGTTTTGGGGTATATGTGSTSGTGTTTGAQAGGRGPRAMTVTNVRMLSESCS